DVGGGGAGWVPSIGAGGCTGADDLVRRRLLWQRSRQSLGNGAQDNLTRLPAFWRRYQRIVVWLALSQMKLDRHTRRSRLCGQIDAVWIEKVERTGEYDYRRQPAEIAIQWTDIRMGDIQVAGIEAPRFDKTRNILHGVTSSDRHLLRAADRSIQPGRDQRQPVRLPISGVS